MKKLLCSVLMTVFLLQICVPMDVYAVTANEDEDVLANYNHHTIEFSSRENDFGVADETKSGTFAVQEKDDGNVDEAIMFVKSLQLYEDGYGYIEEACLEELARYKESGVILESYTVLTPKTRAGDVYYGSYNGRPYYQTHTSVANFRIEKETVIDANTLEQFVEDLVVLVIEFGLNSVIGDYDDLSIAISLIGEVFNVPSSTNITMRYGSYYETVIRATNVSTRVIYAYVDGSSTKRNVYSDQYGQARAQVYFAPVGDIYNDSYQLVDETGLMNVETLYHNDEYYKNRTLQRCHLMYTRGEMEMWDLRTYLTYSWYEESWQAA